MKDIARVADLPLEPGDLEQPFQVICDACEADWCYSYDYKLCSREASRHNKKVH